MQLPIVPNAKRMADLDSLIVYDSHTGGEPTRVILNGAPDLGTGSMAERRDRFAREFDWFRKAVILEPRGSDVLVGALVVPPVDPACVAGVIFFNNVGYLGMCGHGTIGLGVTLAHLGKIGIGRHRLETPVGEIEFDYLGNNLVAVENVPSFRLQKNVPVQVPDIGMVHGDIAWGGNWFFLIENHGLTLKMENVNHLTSYCMSVKAALAQQGITGANGAEIDHIELFAPSATTHADSKNFVLCPGQAYDRSPCGTGTSAKLACLYADGKLQIGDVWRQESIVGSIFEGSLIQRGEQLIPRIVGSAYLHAETKLLFEASDPFNRGIYS
jgi:4-hydroxyproline epimerase